MSSYLLRQGAPKTIAVILPTLRETAYLDFYIAVQSAIQSTGYEARVYTTDDADSIEITILEKVRTSGIVAVLTVSTSTKRCCELYQNFPCPVVYIERQPQDMRQQDYFCGFDAIGIAHEWADILRCSTWKRVALFMSPKHFLHVPQAAQILDDAVSANQMELVRFFSDNHLTLSAAFEIAQADPAFDAIISVGSTHTSSIETAFCTCKIPQPCAIYSITNTSEYKSDSYDTYALDYHQLGIAAANAVLPHLNDSDAPAPQTIIQPKGIPYCFPQLTKVSPTSISLFTLDNPSTNALRKLLPMFESLSGIKVELVCVSYEQLHKRLDNLTHESPYDLIRIDMADFPQIGSRLFAPLSSILPLESLQHQLHDGNYERYSVINGIPYALPFDPSVMLFLYRQDLFSDALLQRLYYEEHREKLEVPKTIEQYIRTARFFTRSIYSGSPTEFGSTTTCGSDATFASDFLPFFLGSGGRVTDGAALYPLNSPAMVDAMTQYKQMLNYTDKQQWWQDSLRKFAAGDTAMTVVYSNYVSDVINTHYSNIVGQVGAAILPGGHPLLGGGVLGVSRYSQKQDACRQFLSWFYSDDIAALMVRLGGTSPFVSAYNDYSVVSPYPWLPAKKESIACGTRGSDDVKIPGFSIRRYEFAIGTAIQKLVLENLPPEHAAVMAQTLYDYYNQG